MAAPRYFEAFKKGEKVRSRSWQIETSDIRVFSGCTSLAGRLFTDGMYCKEHEAIGKPIVPGSLLLNIVDTFFAIHVSPATIPTLHYGYDKVRFLKKVYPGDSVYSVFELVETRIKNDNFGVTTWNVSTYNQNDELVCFHVDNLYIGREGGK